MKRNYIFIEFLIILTLLAIPPIFQQVNDTQPGARSSLMGPVIQLCIALFLDFQHYYTLKVPKCPEKSGNNGKSLSFKSIILVTKWWSLTLGFLMLIYAFFQTLSLFFPAAFNSLHESSFTSFFPEDPLFYQIQKIVMTVFTFACAAYYEEVLYRQFFPESLIFIIKSVFKKKASSSYTAFFFFTPELISLVLFSLAHRYLGIMAVVNAAVCGIVLRICYIKTRGVYTGFAAHFTYNILLFTAICLSR